jgi:hypothetical protein
VNGTTLPQAPEETPVGWHCGIDGHFGVCPVCRQEHGAYINVGRDHWFYCKAHKTKWCAGANLFSGWRDETLNEQERVFDALDFESFDVVKPFHPPDEPTQAQPFTPCRCDPIGAAASMRTGHCDNCGLIVKYENPDGSPFELLCTACDETPSRWTGQPADIASAAAYFLRNGSLSAGRGAVLRVRNGELALGTCRCDFDELPF